MINEYQVALGATVSASDSAHKAYKRAQIEIQYGVQESQQCRRHGQALAALEQALEALEAATKLLDQAVYYTEPN